MDVKVGDGWLVLGVGGGGGGVLLKLEGTDGQAGKRLVWGTYQKARI